VEEWEKAVVLALLIVDDASSRIEYNPATSVDERDDQQKTRAATELFLHTHKTFICRLATTFEIPQFLGVLSLLGEQGLAYKSMWRATIDRAIETQNVEVIADNLQRFKEDERVKTYENNFYEKNVERCVPIRKPSSPRAYAYVTSGYRDSLEAIDFCGIYLSTSCWHWP
jgi:hypothetical protein